MNKALIAIVVLVLGLLGLRYLVLDLASEPEIVVSTSQEVQEQLLQKAYEIPKEQHPDFVDEQEEPGYKPMPVKRVDIIEESDKPVLLKEELVEAKDVLTPEQVLPEVGLLFSDEYQGSEDQRRMELAKFVQSVDPSILEIEKSLAAMKNMNLPADRQQAYTALAEQKVTAMQYLKSKALEQDASLMSLVVE